MHQGQRGVEFLCQGVGDDLLVLVPTGALEEEAVNVAPISRLLADIGGFEVKVLELKGKFVYCDDVLSGVVLESAGEESLGEEET